MFIFLATLLIMGTLVCENIDIVMPILKDMYKELQSPLDYMCYFAVYVSILVTLYVVDVYERAQKNNSLSKTEFSEDIGVLQNRTTIDDTDQKYASTLIVEQIQHKNEDLIDNKSVVDSKIGDATTQVEMADSVDQNSTEVSLVKRVVTDKRVLIGTVIVAVGLFCVYKKCK